MFYSPKIARCLRPVAATALLAGLAWGTGAPPVSAQSTLPPPRSIPQGEVLTVACGDPLSDEDLARIADLSAPVSGDYSLGNFEQRTRDAAEITGILLDRSDRRAIFGLGLDLVEDRAVLPLYRDSDNAGIPNSTWALRLSTDLLDGYLRAIHAHVTGAAVPPHWQRYFELAADCAVPGGYAAMAGYNAHLTVDLAHAVSAAESSPAEFGQYLRIVGAIADQGDAIVAETQSRFDANLAPLWRLYFLGDAADAVTGSTSTNTGIGPGDGHRILLRAGDQSYSALSFTHGLALSDPAYAGAAESSLHTTWGIADQALEALSAGRLL